MSADDARLLLRAAAKLFNAEKYLAAHEVLDDLWEATSGPDEGFYKGLIQSAVAMHHLTEGNLEGALKLHRGQRRLLAPYLPRHLGLNVSSFLEDMQNVFRTRAAEDGSSVHPPPPRIELAEET
jgi:predicted metal-dependent hydrolase